MTFHLNGNRITGKIGIRILIHTIHTTVTETGEIDIAITCFLN